MVAHIIVPVQVNDSVPLIDEDFDAIALDLPLGDQWAALACDEDWDDCVVGGIGPH